MPRAKKHNPNGVLLNAEDIYARWGGKIKMDAVRKLLASGQIRMIRIGNQNCTHLRFVEEFEKSLFALEKPVELNQGTYAAVMIAPQSWINNGARQ